MISKIVQADSFYHTCRYICASPGMEIVQSEGVRDHDFKLMAADFETQAQLRPGKQKACLHAILSFYPGEKPSDEQIREIVNKYLQELKITDTQTTIVKHTNRAHMHLHVLANMINNKGQSISSSWIGLRGKKISQRLTQEYKLTPALEKNLRLTNVEALNEYESMKYKIYMAVAECLPKCKTTDDLEWQLQKKGIDVMYKLKGQTTERQGISFKIGEYSFKGSQVERNFSIKGLERSLLLNQQQSQRSTSKQTILLAKEKINTGQRLPTTNVIPKSGYLPTERHNHPAEKIIPNLAKELGKIAASISTAEENHSSLNHDLTEEQKRKRKRKIRQ